MTDAPDPDVTPDGKDWTWTLQRACPECGLDATLVEGRQLPGQIVAAAAVWPEVLDRVDVRERPRPGVWSPLEYAGHVRDVCRLFGGRLARILTEDSPTFADWDQDAAAVEGDYAAADPRTLATELAEAATAYASSYASVRADQWERTGRRSDGHTFTALTLGWYGLHELVHHAHDVRR